MAFFTMFQIRGRLLRKRTAAPIGWNSLIWCDVRSGGTWRAAMGNPPDVRMMEAWRRILFPGGLFLDVGANAGTYTIFALDAGCEVISIEPNAEARQLLMESLSLNGYTTTVLTCAVADKNGKVWFTDDEDVRNHISDYGIEVEARTLDDIIGDRDVAGIKLDIEGGELSALRGADRLLRERRVAAIQLEWNNMSEVTLGQDRQPVAELLLSYGYHLSRPDLSGALFPITTFDFGRDVFAIRDPA